MTYNVFSGTLNPTHFTSDNSVANNLSSPVHINDIVSRAHKRALAIQHCFVSCDINIYFVPAYKVYVGPLVEHNSTLWSPSTLRDTDTL